MGVGVCGHVYDGVCDGLSTFFLFGGLLTDGRTDIGDGRVDFLTENMISVITPPSAAS